MDEKTGHPGALAFAAVCFLSHVWAFDFGHQSMDFLKEKIYTQLTVGI